MSFYCDYTAGRLRIVTRSGVLRGDVKLESSRSFNRWAYCLALNGASVTCCGIWN